MATLSAKRLDPASMTVEGNLVPPAGLWPSTFSPWPGLQAAVGKVEMHTGVLGAICLPEHPPLGALWGPPSNTTGDSVCFPVWQKYLLWPSRNEARWPVSVLGEVTIFLAWDPPLTRGRLLHCPLPVSVQPSGTLLEHVPITGDPEPSCVGILNVHRPGDL